MKQRCYRQSQQMPLEQFERPEHYDRVARARQGLERRLFSTHRFFWESISGIVALVAIGIYLGQFHWGLPIIVVGRDDTRCVRAGASQQAAVFVGPAADAPATPPYNAWPRINQPGGCLRASPLRFRRVG